MNINWKTSISCCLWTFLLAGCPAQQSHVVKTETIKANANTLFRIGMVKVVVPGHVVMPFSGAWDEKVRALKEIPIEAICSTLKTTYGVNIDTSVGDSIHLVYESDPGSNRNTIAVPYYGNTKFTERSFFTTFVGIRQTVIKSESPSDAVDITYELEQPPFTFTLTYWYSIVVRTGDQEIISHRGIVAKHDLPSNYGIVDYPALWEGFRAGTKSINERFVKDVSK
jgi:hypothetical protein